MGKAQRLGGGGEGLGVWLRIEETPHEYNTNFFFLGLILYTWLASKHTEIYLPLLPEC